MITYTKMYGRFGNCLMAIYTTFYYCKYFNIHFDKIIFNENGLDEKSLWYRKYLTDELWSKFIPHSVWLEYIKNNVNTSWNKIDGIIDNLRSQNNLENVTLCGYSWAPMNIELFGEIFYNKKYFEDVLLRCPIKDLTERVAIHVRRGDLTWKFNKYDYLNNLYKKRIDKNEKYILFSDDIEWCKQNIVKDNILLCDVMDDIEQHVMMTYCKAHVRGYSSYLDTAKYLHSYMVSKKLI